MTPTTPARRALAAAFTAVALASTVVVVPAVAATPSAAHQVSYGEYGHAAHLGYGKSVAVRVV